MAQVMKYWNWPDTGGGQRSYTDAAYGTLSADFGSTAYDWDSMPASLSATSPAAQRSAVATLMLPAWQWRCSTARRERAAEPTA